MAFKLVVLCAALACANAGLLPAAPVAYSPASAVSHAYISTPAVAAPVAIHAPAIGTSQQNVLRSLGGNAAISTYSKAVDSAFSSVRKYDTRVTNDAIPVYAHAAPVATYAHAAPVATYAAPVTTYAHAAPVATYAHAAPVATYAHAAPVATYAQAAPVATYAHAAPVATYAHAAAPVVAKAAIAYSPSVAVSHMTFNGLGVNYAW